MTSFADPRAHLAALWDTATAGTPPGTWPRVVEVTDPDRPTPAGYVLLRVARPDGDNRPALAVLMPSLRDDAPPALRLRHLAATIATASGSCPICHGVAGLSREPPAPHEPGHAVWSVLDLHVVVKHAPGCPASGWSADERRYFLPPVGPTEDTDDEPAGGIDSDDPEVPT